MFGNNYYNRQQSYGPANAAADILGAIMQRNQDKKDENSYMAMLDAGDKISNMKYNPASPEQQPGLFNTNPDITKPLTPDTSQQQRQGFFNMQPDVTKPIQANNSMLTQPITEANMPIAKPQVTQQPTVPKTPTLQDQIGFYKQQIPSAMKELVGKYGKQHAKEIYQHLNQTVNDKITQVTNDYNRQQQDQAYQVLGSNADYKTKFVAGLKSGLKPEMMKMALDNGLEFKFQNMGDRVGVYGVNTHNGLVVDMTTGQQVNAQNTQVGMSPYQSGQLALGAERNSISREGNAIRAAGVTARGSGGGRSGSGKINGMTQLQADNEISKYKQWQSKNPDLTLDDYPRQAQYEAAADPYGNYQQADQIADSIDTESGNPENTFQYLYDRLGYGR
ncbi:hypothetical protein SPSIL_015260 [Sporomusa silvacetica DSM 10669]|uniref:Uncharacterized protein n=1 Tax=Sporomusa silvacetica DSM 10669 TaxID=1123289 RepID=A0ABZ3IIC5_9FIRM|nr:hypothetical protein [Sporomusa silvacetica]OZC21588.1 hypothetical protein SPSIL_09990 [Sporomusa silvacetica DSM 10669]